MVKPQKANGERQLEEISPEKGAADTDNNKAAVRKDEELENGSKVLRPSSLLDLKKNRKLIPFGEKMIEIMGQKSMPNGIQKILPTAGHPAWRHPAANLSTNFMLALGTKIFRSQLADSAC